MDYPWTQGCEVYPRVRGGASVWTGLATLGQGLSPRARGSRRCLRFDARMSRSIPACAGEPNFISYTPYDREVYPRVRGGAALDNPNHPAIKGLSPRARGSPLQ